VAWRVAKTGNMDAVIELVRLQEVLLLSASLARSLEVRSEIREVCLCGRH